MTLLVYIFPACVDLLVGSFFFVGTVRLAESGADAFAVSAVLTAWGVCYMLGSLLSGRLARRGTYIPMVAASCAAMCAAALAFIAVPSLSAIDVIIAVFGVAVAFFFPPYMVFMKDFTAGRAGGLLEATATYTFAWSLGLGAGPFIAGFLWGAAGWQSVFVLDAALAVFAGAGTLILARRAPPPAPQASGAAPSPVRPDMAWVGWSTCGVLLLALAAVRGLFPSTAVLRAIAKSDQGIVLALICVGQAVSSLVIRRRASWMYAVAPVAAFGAAGVGALALFGVASGAPLFMVGAFLLGLCSGMCFNYMTFHSLAHPTRAGTNIGINEAVVGAAGIVGPLAGAGLAGAAGHAGAYLLLAGLAALAFAAQTLLHARRGRAAA